MAAPAVSSEQQPSFTLHSRAGVSSFEWCSGEKKPVRITEDAAESAAIVRAVYSRDGSLLAVLRANDVSVRSVGGAAPAVSFVIPRGRVSRAAFSPQGTYLLTWEPSNNGSAPNLHVWRVAEAAACALCGAPPKPAASFVHKGAPTGDVRQPLLLWSSDEALCARISRDGTVDVISGADPAAPPLRRVPHERAAQLAWCPVGPQQPRHLLAVFSAPRGTGKPGSVSIWDASPESTATAPMSTKSFFSADSCSLEWNPAAGNGGAPLLLAHISTDVDPTGKSYYGQSSLFVLHPTRVDINAALVFQKEGAIHSFAWHPQGRTFSVVYGFMPSLATVFDVHRNGTYSPKADLGPFSRNVVIYSPEGNTLCVGGFGNLQGEMDFFDCTSFARLGRAQAHTSTSWTWSPDGQRFACAICAPRRRVDNGFKVFSATGELLHQEDVPELYEFIWKPDPAATAEAAKRPRPASASQSAAATSAPAAPAPAPAAPAKYIPPGARGIPGANSSIVVHEEQTDHVTVYRRNGQVAHTTVGGGGGRGRGAPARRQQEEDLPPGWEPAKPRKSKKKPKAKQQPNP